MTISPSLPRVLGVVGAGQMGAGIAQVAATAGLSVHLVDASAEGLTRGLAAISNSLHRLDKKGQLHAEVAEAALGRIQTGTDLAALESCDYVVEAVPEREDVKAGYGASEWPAAATHPPCALDLPFAAQASLFRSLEGLLPPQTILASNTSSIRWAAWRWHRRLPATSAPCCLDPVGVAAGTSQKARPTNFAASRA